MLLSLTCANAQSPAKQTNSVSPGESHFVSLGTNKIHYVTSGKGKHTIVLVHCWAGNSGFWREQVPALAGKARLVLIDLPGHGWSDRRSDRNYGPWENALAAAEVIARCAPGAAATIGMSLGGATNIRLAATRPDLVRRAVIIDVSPSVNEAGRAMTPEQRGSVALVSGPPTYDSFAQIFEATMAASPKRTEAGIRRGVRHNTIRLSDGRWAWRYDLFGGPDPDPTDTAENWVDFSSLWDDVAAIPNPTMLVVGGDSVYVRAEDVEEYRRRLPSVRVESVPGAGHAVQSDQPAALVELLNDFVPR